MSFWKNYDADPGIMAQGDQYDQMGEAFLDNLIQDVYAIREEYGDYPLVCLLAAELAKEAEENDIVELAIPLALAAAMLRLAKLNQGDGPSPDISGLDFDCGS